MTTDEIEQAVKKASQSSLRSWHAMRFCAGFVGITDDAFLKAVSSFYNNGHLMRIHEGHVYITTDAS